MLVAGLLLFAGWAAAGAVVLLQAVSAAEDARASLDDVRDELTVDALLRGSARTHLDPLRADLHDVERAVRSPAVLPLRVLPGVGRHVRTVDALSRAGLDAATVADVLLEELEASVDDPLPTGRERVALVRRIRSLLADARSQLGDIDAGPDGPLLGPLDDARAEARERLDELERLLERAEATAGAVETLLSGGTHLLLVANNGEMRASSGMFLQVGALESAGGTLRVADLEVAARMRLPAGAVDPGSETYGALWGFLRPSEEWRNLAASPRFDVTAELASRMWQARGHEAPASVLAVDPHVVRALLAATGPVSVDGTVLGADDVVQYLLHDQYDVFGDEVADAGPSPQSVRRDRLGDLVAAALAALETGDVDVVTLVEGLRDAVRGRHLLAWSPDPQAQRGWEAAEMSGSLEADSIAVSLLNRGANKLDLFVDVDASLSFGAPVGDRRPGSLEITVRNRTPSGEVPYVVGPNPAVPDAGREGDYVGFVEVTLPGVARDATIAGVPELEVARADGPTLTLATRFVLGRQAERRFTVRFDVPASLQTVRIEPDARPTPVRWHVAGRVHRDGEHHRVPVVRASA